MDSHGKPDKKPLGGSPKPEQDSAADPNPAAPLLAGDDAICLHWEASLVDLLDGVLAPEEEARFREHAEGCAQCQALLRESERGREWARLLHDTPPPVPEHLLGRILAQTAGSATDHAIGALGAAGYDAGPGAALPLGAALPHPAAWSARGQRQARVLMTAAMAFFSIALTLSMTGFHLSDVRAAVHSPGSLGVSASRQFFDTRKQVVNFYENLRVVREMEVTVEDLRQSANSGGKKAERPRQPQPSARRSSGNDAPAVLMARCAVHEPLPCGKPTFRDRFTYDEHRADERNTL